MNIIENGKILESKLYSTNEATLIVSNSKKFMFVAFQII